MKNRIVVIVNKAWEAAPILEVFRAPFSIASDLSQSISSRPYYWSDKKQYPSPEMWPGTAGQPTFPLRYLLHFDDTRVECWCLADFNDTSDILLKTKYVPQIVAAEPEPPQLVIAIGTAASTVPGLQGSVVGGCRAFMHDANPDQPVPADRPPTWPVELINKMMESAFAPGLRNLMAGQLPSWMTSAERRMIPERNGESRLRIVIEPELVAVGDVNVGNPIDYAARDPESLKACIAADPRAEIGSVETTSALIRAMVEPAPYMFLSGIANDLGQFSRDVGPTPYSQNFAAAHNVGVVLAALLPEIVASQFSDVSFQDARQLVTH